ncbi:FliI/YscN family ATPase [Anaerohalosphaera lusitana]|nr:FliI/YscN family ATPase [Anaerohalosphaera lusitana]
MQSKLFDIGRVSAALDKVETLPTKGQIVRVSGTIVESKGPNVGLGELCGIHLDDGNRVLAEVIGFRESKLVLLPLDEINGIRPGNIVTGRAKQRNLKVGPSILGRVLDGLGRPIDGKGPLTGSDERTVENAGVCPLSRKKISEPLSLGIRSIDGMITCGKGQRVGIFAGSGVGKSVLMGEIAKSSEADVNVVALVGERGREVREFLEENLGPEGLARSVVVVATSDSAAVQRVRAGFVAATIAEYFRDQGMDVLFMMDSLTRLAQAQREIGLSAGEPPATKGYCPSVFKLLPKLIERLGCGSKGSITGMLTVLTEGDDMNDPVADSARSLLDGHMVLTRKLAEKGHYPAIDILASVSRLMTTVASDEHVAAARKLKEIYATYADAEDLINIGAFQPGSNMRIDAAVALIEDVRDFLIQHVNQRTGFGKTVARLVEIANAWDQMIAQDGQTVAAGSEANSGQMR